MQIIECPRDAMQGIQRLIPTELKIRYLNLLLQVGFDTLDFGSFVSPKAVPQMADTTEVLAGLDLGASATRLLAIVANLRGAEEASTHPGISFLGYPFSISETFQQRNTRKGISESFELVKALQDLCVKNEKELVVYLSMAFGNPYGDPWSPEAVEDWVEKMAGLGIRIIALADTVGSADPESISRLFRPLIPRFPEVQIGAHFHSHPAKREEKLKAAYESGCRRFDTALMGFGGCPFAKDELVGNISTESLIAFCRKNNLDPGIHPERLAAAAALAPQVFG